MYGTIGNATAGSYTITVEIDDCVMEFSYTLAGKPFDVEFFEYDEATEDCIYEESCRGFVYDYSVQNSFKAPYLATSNPCEIPIYCRSNPKPIKVGSKKYEKRLCRGLKYYQLLQGLMFALGTDYANDLGFSQGYLQELRDDYNHQDDCRWVRYCTANMKKIYSIGLGSYATYIGQSVNDCEKYKCPTFLNPTIRICPGENCMKFPGSAAPGIDVDPPEPPCYQYRNANLYGLIYAFEQGWLEDIANTNLYYEISLLATSLNTSDRNRAKCATAYFCIDNYQFLYHTLDEVDCSVVGVPVFENYWELCPAGGAPVLVENCHTATNLINVCETVEEVYDENGDLIGELVACRKNCLWEGVDCVEESVIDYGAILAILGIENGLVPTTGEGEEKLNFKALNDDLLVEKLDDFSFLTFQGVTVPKPMISTEQGRGYYDYTSGGSAVERKVLEPGLLFQNHNWDTNQELYAYQTDSGVRLSYEDSIAVWDMDLHSSQDSFMVLESATILPDFTGLEIKGSFKGDLNLNDLVLASETQNSIFVISFSTEGQVIDYNIVRNVDYGRHFRGGSEGNAVFITDYSTENGDIEFGDVIIDAPEESEKGKLIGVWDAEQKDFLYRKKIVFPEHVSIAAADFQVDRLAVAIKNAGAITQDQNDIDKVRVDSVELSKTMIVRYHPSALQHNWASTVIEGGGIEQIAIEFTPNGGFFVGLTITDNLLVEGYTVEHIGGKDIVILQYGSGGELVGVNIYGTLGDETVEKLFFNHDRLFFSGIVDGNVIERDIGDYTFRDITPFNAEVYVSEIQANSAQQLIVSEAVKQTKHSITEH